MSHHNVVVYSELKRCGATFAILKMDRRFAEHHSALKAVGIKTMPYHYLSVASNGVDYKKRITTFSAPDGSKLPQAEMDRLLVVAENMGVAKAREFVRKYEAALGVDERSFELAGLSGKIVVLDVEEAPSARPTVLQARSYGRFYARMLSSWVKEVRLAHPDITVVFYTFPAIYTDYLQYAYPADHAVLHGMPVWLARTRGDASDFDLKSDQRLQRICLSASGGNKCILHQYSHRALFGVPAVPRTTPPAHIDVNRLFRVKEVRDGEGVQLVRDDTN